MLGMLFFHWGLWISAHFLLKMHLSESSASSDIQDGCDGG